MNADDVIRTDLDDMCGDLDTVFSEMVGSTVLLTGGGGFLGWYLTAAPLAWNRAHPDQAPIRVLSTDVFPRGRPDWLTAMAQDPNLEVRTHNAVQGLPEDVRPDYVIHAASIASPTFYRQHPIETMDANVLGLRHVLDAAVQRQKDGAPLAGILFFSSSEVYGDPDGDHIPTDESYWGRVSFTGPRSCYDESKRYGEALCMAFFRVHGIPIRIARPFNNYGPGLALADRRVIPDFLRDVLGNRDIVLLSDGSPTRTFCYVADAVCGYYRLLVRGRDGQAYNIGQDSRKSPCANWPAASPTRAGSIAATPDAWCSRRPGTPTTSPTTPTGDAPCWTRPGPTWATIRASASTRASPAISTGPEHKSRNRPP